MNLYIKATTTELRKKAKSVACVGMNKILISKFHIKKNRLAIIEINNRKIFCKILLDSKLKNNEIRMDHTLRCVLEIDLNDNETENMYNIHFHNIRTDIRDFFQRISDKLFGKKYIYLRVFKADEMDMEKSIVRLQSQNYDIIGCQVGDFLMFESVTFREGNHKLIKKIYRGLATDESNMKLTEKYQSYNKYLKARKEFTNAPSTNIISPVFIDFHDREHLSVDVGDCIRVSRSVRHLIFRNIREYGIILMLTILAVFQIFPDKGGFEKNWLNFAILTILSIVITLSIIITNMRSLVK